MKSFLYTLFFFLMMSQICFGQWYQQNSGTTKNLRDVVFLNPSTGIAVGDSGIILRTTNGGTLWSVVPTGISNDFTGMCFIDESEGWAATGNDIFWLEPPDSSFIFHTTDAGVTWIEQLSLDTTLFNDVSFIDANNGWVVGTSSPYGNLKSIILKTTDGGTTWSQQLIDSIPFMRKVDFVNSSIGWIIAWETGWNSNSIYKTNDGANTLSLQLYEQFHLNDIIFYNLDIGVAVGIKWLGLGGQAGLVIKTTDGGTNWTEILSDPSLPMFNGIFFSSENIWTLVGEEGIILRTSEGGVSWEEQTSGTTNALNNVYFTDALNGWIVGNNGIIIHTTNGGVSSVDDATSQLTEFFLEQNYPNPFNPSTKIKYSVPQTSLVEIKIFDVLGNEVTTLVNEEKPVGSYELTWNAANLPSGVYFYQLRAGEYAAVKKMILIK